MSAKQNRTDTAVPEAPAAEQPQKQPDVGAVLTQQVQLQSGKLKKIKVRVTHVRKSEE